MVLTIATIEGTVHPTNDLRDQPIAIFSQHGDVVHCGKERGRYVSVKSDIGKHVLILLCVIVIFSHAARVNQVQPNVSLDEASQLLRRFVAVWKFANVISDTQRIWDLGS